MARERPGPQPASSDVPSQGNSSIANTSASRKRQVDWAAVDADGSFDGFTVKTVSLSTRQKPTKSSHKKQKTTTTPRSRPSDGNADAPTKADMVQPNPYPKTKLSEVYCQVVPAALWESTRRYRKFTIDGVEFQTGQVIYVKNSEEREEEVDHDAPTSIPQWFAYILEVRGGDAAHVFLRVYWAYRPQDLPGGRQSHHGANELIVSNHMDIIDALSVDGIAQVAYWDEDVENEWPDKDQLFWRQSLDINKPRGRRLTTLRTYCVDKAPCNPDEPLVHCPSCNEWLHARCLEEQSVQDAHNQYMLSQPKGKGRTKDPSSTPLPFTAKLVTSDSGKTTLTVTHKRKGQENRQWDVDVQCLLCKETVEKADDHLPERPASTAPIPPQHHEEELDNITIAPAASSSEQPIVQRLVSSIFGNGPPAPFTSTTEPTTNIAEPESATPTPANTISSSTSFPPNDTPSKQYSKISPYKALLNKLKGT
ncbi:uncharacterized protein K460DRAFT_207565 [Cucurbitaria berberidis CBS 394.84]|uniref:BAH domain-containing protein n=1 Tax=Cucurbitaria berberidis CBS 394.84 TaxID=1168544 RepID=A0A9P4L3H5_9PLEO|nr:uncharacterized protein K460DRAFT_207565 [Cucurbitaria berberidis CBS 394.84]KAF1840395.1 hypothetical protein K460DRAFT_207565 [Cucurbitaria berberidis CBS 394.84]